MLSGTYHVHFGLCNMPQQIQFSKGEGGLEIVLGTDIDRRLLLQVCIF